MTIIRLHRRQPHYHINCTSVPLLVLPLVRDKDEAAAVLLLANLPSAHVQQLHSCAATSAITKLERYFIKNVWMPKEA